MAAQDNGYFARELAPVEVVGKNGQLTLVSVDEYPRPGMTLEVLGALATPFGENGTVTAGNSSGVNDGAAALILAS